jgi:hypothetical protein
MDNDETVAKAFRICVEADNCGVQDEAPCHTMDCPIAAAIRAAVEAEREACAQVAHFFAVDGPRNWTHGRLLLNDGRDRDYAIADAIRARGKETT